MGVCCSFNKNSEAEDFVITQIKSEVLKLNEFDYNKLLNVFSLFIKHKPVKYNC